jgi:phosphoglycerate dehydrogenase-like enzyme
MPVIVVEEDRILRQVQIALDPRTPDERLDAYASYTAHDVDLRAWRDRVRARVGGLYPSEVRLVKTDEELRRALPDADAVIVESLTLGAAELASAPRLKWVQAFGAFAHGIDAEACRMRGLTIHTVRRRTNRVVAEHTLMLMLALAKRLPLINGLVTRERLAARHRPFEAYDTRHTPGANFARVPEIRTLVGAKLGLLGFGEIARELVPMARAIGMEVLYHKPRRLAPEEEKAHGVIYCSFEALFAQSDYLSVHVPSTDATRDLVDDTAIRRMKPSAFLINTSRAAIVNYDAMLSALTERRIAGAGLDVLHEEPAREDEPLLEFENVIVTPHCAGASRLNSLSDMEDMLVAMAAGVAG